MSGEERDYNPADNFIKLSGKAYLPVAQRIVWFRNDYPEGTIETTIVEIGDQRAVFHARVTTGQGGAAEATGTETPRDFGDYIEKAETKAVGRALGYLGYGTASAGFEEGGRVVDAPQDRRPPKAPERAPQPPGRAEPPPPAPEVAQPAQRRKMTDADDAELLVWVKNEGLDDARRCRAAEIYLGRAATEFEVLQRAEDCTALHPDDVARLRDEALAALRDRQPASIAG